METRPIDFRDAQTGEQLPDPTHMVMTLPTSRAQAHKKRELESLTKQWRSSLSKEPFRATQAAEKPAVQTPSSGQHSMTCWIAILIYSPICGGCVSAVAFYRPFHWEPFEKWGIYIFIDRLMNYAQTVGFVAPFQPRISQQALLHLVIFEMFHHEFYHHLVESAATTIEILANALGAPAQSHFELPPGRARGAFRLASAPPAGRGTRQSLRLPRTFIHLSGEDRLSGRAWSLPARSACALATRGSWIPQCRRLSVRCTI